MKKIFLCCAVLLVTILGANAAEPVIRRSIFSTSTDWEAITGLHLNEYQVFFGRDRTMGNIGAELYFLDGFPCYAQSDRARVWISPAFGDYAVERDNHMRIVCLNIPETVQLAFRVARRTESQGRTQGLLVCGTQQDGRDIIVDLTACKEIVKWEDFK